MNPGGRAAVPVWPEALGAMGVWVPNVMLDGVVHVIGVLDKAQWTPLIGRLRDLPKRDVEAIMHGAPVRILCEDSRTLAPWRSLPRTSDRVTCLECLTYVAGRHGA